MADTNIRVGVDLDAKKAVAGLEDVADAATDAQKAVDKLDGTKVGPDTKEAARSLDDVLERVDKLSSLGGKRILLESNAKEIGTEMADLLDQINRADAADITVDAKIEQVDALQGDLDRLEAKVREINATPVDLDTTRVSHGIDEVGRSADSSKSALANMVGNATQDLGSLGGVAGSTGVAIGQMAEYMADAKFSGEGLGSVLKSFGLVAGPIAAISIGINLITSALERQRQAAEEAEERLKALVAAQEDLAAGNTAKAAEKLTDTFSELFDTFDEGGVPARQVIDYLLGISDSIGGADLAGKDFGATATELMRAFPALGTSAYVAAGRLRQARGEVEKAPSVYGAHTERVKEATKALTDNQAAALGAAAATRIHNRDLQDQAKYVDTFVEKENRRTEATRTQQKADEEATAAAIKARDEEARKIKEVSDALLNANQAYRAYFDTVKGGERSFFGARRAEDAFADSIASLSEDLKKATKDSTGAKDAARNQQLVYDDLVQSAIDVAEQHQAIAESLAKQRGEVYSANQAQRDFLNSLVVSSQQLKGPARDALVNYIAAVGKIEPKKVTEILAQPKKTKEQIAQDLNDVIPDATEAPIEMKLSDESVVALATAMQTAIDQSVLKLLYPTLTFPSAVNTKGAQDDIDKFVKEQANNEVKMFLELSDIQLGGHSAAAGGTGGGGTVGVTALSAAPMGVVPAGSTRALSSGGGPTFNINVQVAPTASAATVGGEIVRAIQAYESRSGKTWRAA